MEFMKMPDKELLEKLLGLKNFSFCACGECKKEGEEKKEKEQTQKEFVVEIDEEVFETRVEFLPYWVNNFESSQHYIKYLHANLYSNKILLQHVFDKVALTPDLKFEIEKIAEAYQDFFEDYMEDMRMPK